MLLLLLLLLLLALLLLLFCAVVAVAVAAGVASADENLARQIPNRADFGPTWDRTGGRRPRPPPWWKERGRRPQQRGVLGGIAKTTKPLFLLHQIANFGLGCDLNKTQHRLWDNGKPFEFIEDSY